MWIPPTMGSVRFNTDGASKDGDRVGCGGLLRVSNDEWLGGFGKPLGMLSAYVAVL
jgi:hypothetical protein